MSRSVRFTPRARGQFLAALAYIRADRPSAAESLKTRAHGALSNLGQFPESGRVVPEFPTLGFREVLIGTYRFFYRVKDDLVWVVGVWHDAQIPDEPDEPGGG